ncbi:hypothetical protein [Aphanothece sacrum]|uniref:Uncharacterized protein n=1 Tax=Aphanothece sacrum FPU1 TaxID=1920663 RepID=A0A401II13_APHSA|nr:hypothetical protein [Aphanothece sacrum]GBF80820.1 hypothetical protein AsFPU1_2225 [Aphanothece sacrum FPU1]GBF83315.1 hypothetical protein AsFPU3_0355 [Aphanothece sacrum FPU3]
MIRVKVEVKKISNSYNPIIPITIPNIEEVKDFANQLHEIGKEWKGEFSGWQAEYNPEKKELPIDSKMTFTPADFCIGESGIWFFSLMWEKGKDAEPVEFLDDSNITLI